MIAANYRKHPDALQHQMCLDFGALLRWATARPTTRALRAIRAARARLVQMHKQAPPWFPPIAIDDRKTPAWYADARKAARALAERVRAACRSLV